MSGETGSARWKQKYYDSLEQIEKKERQWQGVENLLRRGIARLTLAARGVNDTLDRDLERLRNAIRDGRDSAALQQLIEDIGGSVARLDQERARSRDPKAGKVLAQLLDKFSLPRRFSRKARGLGKRLEDARDQAELTPLMDELCALLQRALINVQPPPARDAPDPLSATDPPDSPGLIKKLFGRGTAAENEEDASAGTTRQAHQPEASSAHFEINEEDQRPCIGQIPVKPRPALHEMLIQLLELLELPQEMDEQVNALRDRLEQKVEEEHYAEALEAVAGLVAEARARLQNEKNEITEFLKRINARIQEMDQHVQGASVEQQRGFESGNEFAAAVQMQVRSIEQSVQSAVDLEQLKLAVQTSLDALHIRIIEQRKSETLRQAGIQRQLHTLTEKLRNMEGEGEQLRNRLQQKHKLALQDSLTGLPNRLAYKERMNHEYARWKRYAAPLTLLVWDVDRFKTINDTYGHKAGDKALKTISQLLQGQLRATDFLARYGGEEFVMLMPETTLNDALAAAEKLLVAVANSNFHYREQAVPISISCGLSEFCAGDTPETAFERADQAMYRAKQAGGNRCQYASSPAV